VKTAEFEDLSPRLSNIDRTKMAVRITVKTNGSLRVEGEVELFDGQGRKFDLGGRTSISLCRCGQSKDKPFCDRSHRECGFASEVTARTLAPDPPKV